MTSIDSLLWSGDAAKSLANSAVGKKESGTLLAPYRAKEELGPCWTGTLNSKRVVPIGGLGRLGDECGERLPESDTVSNAKRFSKHVVTDVYEKNERPPPLNGRQATAITIVLGRYYRERCRVNCWRVERCPDRLRAPHPSSPGPDDLPIMEVMHTLIG